MRIVIAAIGTRGDVQPYVALGYGLRQAGHDVRIVAHERFAPLAARYGLQHAPIGSGAQPLLSTPAGRDFVEKSGAGLVRSLRLALRMLANELDRAGLDFRAAARDADLILTSPLGVGLAHPVAEALNVPMVRAFYAPNTATRYQSAINLPRGVELGARGNLATYALRRQMMWLLARPAANRWRQQLGLPPLSLRDPMIAVDRLRLPVVYGYSDVVYPRPPDWPQHVHVTGYWTLPELTRWIPPAVLRNFLQDGQPPVYVGFGSMPGFAPEQLADIVRSAIRRSGRRVILQRPPQPATPPAAPQALSDDLLMIDEVPHTYLFPRVAAVVHHGGCGTVAASLTAGKPTQVVPFLLDQHLWAHRVAALGAGPAAIKPGELTGDRLGDILTELTTTPEMQRTAAYVGSRLRAENGVDSAVSVLERYFADPPRSVWPLSA